MLSFAYAVKNEFKVPSAYFSINGWTHWWNDLPTVVKYIKKDYPKLNTLCSFWARGVDGGGSK